MNSESPLPVKTRIFNIIQIGDKSNRISRAFDIFITVVIFSNILVTFLQTFSELSFLSGFFHVTEVVTLCIFCIEYALRIWTADLLYPSKSRLRSRLRFLGKSGHSRRAHIRNNISGLNFLAGIQKALNLVIISVFLPGLQILLYRISINMCCCPGIGKALVILYLSNKEMLL